MEVLTAAGPKQVAFSPYQDNGGTALAVSGKDFVVIASDTRISTGYSIHTRDGNKIAQLTDKCVIASSGMQADIKTLFKVLQMRMKAFEQQHRRNMPTPAIAQMLGNTLYYKRFFPYYTFNILAGLNEEGEGCVYSYDAVGSFQRVPVSCTGSGHELIQPLLDNQIDRAHQKGLGHWDLSEVEAVELVKDAFSSACERDIYTGDHVDIAVINKTGIHWDKFDLKFD